MALTANDQQILEEIIQTEGDCLDGHTRCQGCPFRSMCLPEFLNTKTPTKRQRFDLALRILTHHALLDPNIDINDIKQEYNCKRGINNG